MRCSKDVPFVGLLMICFMVAAQPAKADDIIFNDLGDTILVTGTGRFSNLSVSCAVELLCTVKITPPAGVTLVASTSFASTSLPHNINLGSLGTLWALGITEPGGGGLSDALVISNSSLGTFVNFLSDPPATAGGELSLGTCGTTFPNLNIPVPCDVSETGAKQLAGTINWGTGGTVKDNVYFLSEVPEPASLMLFGSGLVIAGGFLRRRRQLMTPSV
jgi:hypothetical protein